MAVAVVMVGMVVGRGRDELEASQATGLGKSAYVRKQHSGAAARALELFVFKDRDLP